MRKIIIATAALAFLTSGAFAQDKAGSTAAPAASGDSMSKGDMSKMSKKSSKKSKKSSMMKSGDDTKSGDAMKK
jgi:hypothetical protein